MRGRGGPIVRLAWRLSRDNRRLTAIVRKQATELANTKHDLSDALQDVEMLSRHNDLLMQHCPDDAAVLFEEDR